MGKLSISPGNVFHRLTVLRRLDDKIPGRPRWECRCICGGTAVVGTGQLRNGNTRSCGCLLVEHGKRWAPQMSRNFWAKGPLEAATKRMLGEYRRGAEKRGLSFELTVTDVKSMIVSECWYCGSAPSRSVKSTRPLGLYSGIDRKDNEVGYSLENCVPCCAQCNRAKNKFPASVFLSWVYRVYRYSSGV